MAVSYTHLDVYKRQVVDARCTIPNAGAINLSTLAGTPTRYVWTNATGGTVGTNAPIISNLLPGKYNVQVTDAGGCDTTLRDITVGAVSYTHLDVYKRQYQRFLHVEFWGWLCANRWPEPTSTTYLPKPRFLHGEFALSEPL